MEIKNCFGNGGKQRPSAEWRVLRIKVMILGGMKLKQGNTRRGILKIKYRNDNIMSKSRLK